MFTLVTVDVNLCHACKQSINNTQNEVERHPGPDIHSIIIQENTDIQRPYFATEGLNATWEVGKYLGDEF